MTTLQPCPFCGFTVAEIQHTSGDERTRIKCPSCKVRTKWYRDEDVACMKWNRRDGE